MPTPPFRLAPGLAGRLVRWLQHHGRWSTWLIAGAALLLGGSLATGLGRAVRDWVRDPSGRLRRTLVVPQAEAAPPLSYAHATAPPAAAPATAKPQPPVAAPAMNWEDPDRLRQAASALADAGDLDAALGLLLQHGVAPQELRAVGQAGYGQLQTAMRAALTHQHDSLATWWQSQDTDTRQACFGSNGKAKAAALTKLLAPGAATTSPAVLLPSLPVSLGYVYLHNLTTHLRETPAVSPFLAGLVISIYLLPSPLLQPATDAATPTSPPVAYADHVTAFAAYLDSAILPGLAQAQLSREQTLQGAAAAPLREWYARVYGTDFTHHLDTLPTSPGLDRLQQLWLALPAGPRVLWASDLAQLAATRYSPLPTAVSAASTWLAPMTQSLNKAALLQAIRQHPMWQRDLAGWQYDDATADLPTILQALHAQTYSVTLTLALNDRLGEERRQIFAPITNWNWLADSVGVAETRPGEVQGAHTRIGLPPAYPHWRDVPPAILVQRLKAAIPQWPKAQRPAVAQLIQLLAVNRGLELDSQENNRYPALAPNPQLP